MPSNHNEGRLVKYMANFNTKKYLISHSSRTLNLKIIRHFFNFWYEVYLFPDTNKEEERQAY